MNTINIAIDFTNGTNRVSGISLITGDYASTKIVFQFDREDGTKVFELKNPSGETRYVGEIVNNEVILTGVDDGNNYSIFNEAGLYIYEVSLYDGDSKLTSAKGQLPVKQEQVIVGDETIEPYLPIFDQLMQEINTAITETNNLNISVDKIDGTTTIVLTKKDGEETDTIINDLQFNWDGTRLGVKTSSESEYQYVDLKGSKGDAGAIKMLIVAELPATGADDTIYLVPLENPDVQGNNYAEYVYINGAWELLGRIGVQVDLTDYVKFTDYATTSNAGVIKVAGWARTAMDNGVLTATTTDYSIYSGTANSAFISKGTLENVITGKGLVSNTDYANTTTAGVFKSNSAAGTGMNSNDGVLYALTKTYSQYNDAANSLFIGKGTLENVLTNRIGAIDSVLDAINGEVI